MSDYSKKLESSHESIVEENVALRAEVARLRATVDVAGTQNDTLRAEVDLLNKRLEEARQQAYSGHDWNRLLGERDAALAHLYDLLARIHRDGGHYVATHGLEKACADADLIVAMLFSGKGP
jgi:regulator of replication initiation timing